MEAHNSAGTASGPSYEMQAFSGLKEENVLTQSPVAVSEPSLASVPHMHDASSQEGLNIQELAPIDRGIQAWTFCASGFALETLVWGFGYRLALVHNLRRRSVIKPTTLQQLWYLPG